MTTSQVVVNWAPGSVHTVSAVNPAVTGGSRQTFAMWSDGGASTHQIVVPSSSYSLRADYTTAYKLSTAAAPVGSVNTSPATVDGFYTANTIVQVAASAPTGYCFAGWTGLIAGTPTATSLNMNSPYSIQANFQIGDIVASPSNISTTRSGGTYTISVSANTGCAWRATSNASWVTIQSGASGTGPGVVTIVVEDTKKNKNRTAQIAIGTALVTVSQ
jgi:hypothetical protein